MNKTLHNMIRVNKNRGVNMGNAKKWEKMLLARAGSGGVHAAANNPIQ